MTAHNKPRGSSKPRPVKAWQPRYLTDENGTKTAVLLPLEAWERVAPFLQSDLELALLGEAVTEDVAPRIAKRLRDHAKGKKDEMLTPEAFHAEVESLGRE